MRTPFFVSVALVSTLIVAGCLSARKTEPLAPPLELREPKLRRGEHVFFAHCHQCHPHGESGLGPAIVNKPLPSFLMKFQVRHGLGAMPSFGPEKISSEELDALMAYLKAVRGNPPLTRSSGRP